MNYENGESEKIQKQVTSEVRRLSMKHFRKEVPPIPKTAAITAMIRNNFDLKMNCFICEQQVVPNDRGGCQNCGLFCLIWAIYFPALYGE